ncbi:MAG: hypothetical protein PHT88_04575 [Candidatus Moranbacteria bacterium]|nr:hypothetical protein [Candidatus Moranbacteria bacterium]
MSGEDNDLGGGCCCWRQEDDWENADVYNTACGDSFCLVEATPEANGMRFCCYCGKPLIQIQKSLSAAYKEKVFSDE